MYVVICLSLRLISQLYNMNKDQLIIATALKLFVENGFHGTATSKIAQESGVANGTLFNYFATKEILIVVFTTVLSKKRMILLLKALNHILFPKNLFVHCF